MDMSPPDHGGGENDHNRYDILLVSLNARYWLVRGIEHLDTMLKGQGTFPTPVGCMIFRNHAHMRSVVPPNVDLAACWMINPLIVHRLKENAQLVEFYPES